MTSSIRVAQVFPALVGKKTHASFVATIESFEFNFRCIELGISDVLFWNYVHFKTEKVLCINIIFTVLDKTYESQ